MLTENAGIEFLRGNPSADKVDNFQAIAIVQFCFGPLFPRNDVSVQLYGDAIGFHSQLLKQACERERSGKIAVLAIDLKFHLGVILLSIKNWKRPG
jgi:hypothetical protein